MDMAPFVKLFLSCCAFGLTGTWAFSTPTRSNSSPINRELSESEILSSADEEDIYEGLQKKNSVHRERNMKPFEINHLHLFGSLLFWGAVAGFPTGSTAVFVTSEVTLPSSLILTDQNKADEDAMLLEAFGAQLMQNLATDSTQKPNPDGANNNSQSKQDKASGSDMDQALQQLQKRKQVDPRTHG